MHSGLTKIKDFVDRSFQDTFFVEQADDLPEAALVYYNQSLAWLDQLQYDVKHRIDEETLYFKEKKRSSSVANLHSAYVRMMASLVRRRGHVEEELPALGLDGVSAPVVLLLKRAIEACEGVLEMLEDEYPNDIELDVQVASARHGILIDLHEPRFQNLLKQFRLRPPSKEGLMAIVGELIHPFFDYEIVPTRRRFAVIRHFLTSLESSQRAKKRIQGKRSITARQIISALIMANHNEPFVVEVFSGMLDRHLDLLGQAKAISYLKSSQSFLKAMSPPRREGSSPEHPSLWEQINKLIKVRLEQSRDADFSNRKIDDAIKQKIRLGISVEAFGLLATLASEARIIESITQAGLARQLITTFSRQDGEAIAEKSLIKRMSSPNEQTLDEVKACLELIGCKLNRRLKATEKSLSV